jgi:hypothetical protein
MGLAADLIKYDHELTRQHADEEFREGIADNCDKIKELLPELSDRNLRSIKAAAQDIIDDVDRRL